MRVLLDECLPRQLAGHSAGHDVTTVTQAGWSGEQNGDLLRLAEGRFEVLLTIDRRLAWQEDVPGGLALITVEAPSNRLSSLLPLVPAILEALGRIRPGQSIRVS